jgi:hypothetical protein
MELGYATWVMWRGWDVPGRASLMSSEHVQGSDELSQGIRADPPSYQTAYVKTCSVSSSLLGSTPNR